jgi:NitT/TauT family transport system substrate-binding protein
MPCRTMIDSGFTPRHGAGLAAMAFIAALGLSAQEAAGAEHIKVGLLLTAGSGPVYVAQEKGYFTAEGLDVELVPFDAGQPVAVATVSGDIDFGTAGVTSALYTLCAQGALRIVAGSTQDRPGFPAAGLMVSNQAYAAGLKTFRNLGGHSTALTQIGSTYHYAFALVAGKYHVDMKTVRTLPLQSLANDAAALIGGQADTAMLTANQIAPIVAQDKAKLLGWVGEQVPWQVAMMWTSAKTANGRRATVEHFLRAVRHGSHDVDAAFVGPDGKRKDGPTAPEITAIIAKYIKLPVEKTSKLIGYTDPDLRINEKDVARQLAWYHSQGMIKDKVTIDQVIDKRYAEAMR